MWVPSLEMCCACQMQHQLILVEQGQYEWWFFSIETDIYLCCYSSTAPRSYHIFQLVFTLYSQMLILRASHSISQWSWDCFAAWVHVFDMLLVTWLIKLPHPASVTVLYFLLTKVLFEFSCKNVRKSPVILKQFLPWHDQNTAGVAL